MKQKSLFGGVVKQEQRECPSTKRPHKKPVKTNETRRELYVYDPVYMEIQRCRLRILVHSCLYYVFNENLIEDYEYDSISKQLAQLQKEYPKISEKVAYYEDFKDWDGETSSGFNLPIRSDYVLKTAEGLLEYAT